jgi:hypothetical protein
MLLIQTTTKTIDPYACHNDNKELELQANPIHVECCYVRLSEDEQGKLCNKNKCFVCKREGHIDQFCPDNQDQGYRQNQQGSFRGRGHDQGGYRGNHPTFQSMMNHLFKDLIDRNVVVVYMDDILIYTKDLEEHRKVTEEVLRILKDNNLYLKPEKCKFEQTKIEYLGLIILENHVKMDKVKVQGVLDWPTPPKVKDVQAFLGFANFYQWFVENFSKAAHPLTQLTRKDLKWEWTKEAEEAFNKIERRFTTAPVLVMADSEHNAGGNRHF